MSRRYILPTVGDITVSAAAADKLIAGKNGGAALLYVYILKMGGLFSESEAMAALGMSEESLDGALSALAEMGLIAAGDKKSSEAPSSGKEKAAGELPARVDIKPDAPAPPEPTRNPYTAEEVLDEMERRGEFYALVSETERRLSMARPCSVEEMKRLMWLYQDAGLPLDVIFLLLTHCQEEWERKYSGSRHPTVRQVEAEGARWARMGLDSYDAAHKYIRKRKKLLSDMGQCANLLGLGARELAPSEEKYLSAWLDMGFKSAEIQEAYDRTVLSTGGLSWKYMNSIIKRWNEQGLKTLRDIREADRLRAEAGSSGKGAAAGKKSGAPAADPMKNESLSWVRDRIKKKEAQGK